MDQLQYRNFFHAISKNHTAIANTDDNERFFEILRSFDPLLMEWDKDFVNGLRSKLKLMSGEAGMVLEAIETAVHDPGAEDRIVMPMGAFLILKKANLAKTGATPLEIATCLSATNAICEQIMAYLIEHCDKMYQAGTPNLAFYLDQSSIKLLPVGPWDSNIWGTRVEFTWKTPKNQAFVYDDQYWSNPL